MNPIRYLLLTLGLATCAFGQVYNISDLSVKPKPVSQPHPHYPAELRAAGKSGTVLIEFVVAADGSVQDAKVIRSGDAGFDESALAAVASWKFSPGMVEGHPVATRIQVPIMFQPRRSS